MIGPLGQGHAGRVLELEAEQRVLRAGRPGCRCETRLPSTSLLTIGSRADFCRARSTGWSITYWKKSPRDEAVATLCTLRAQVQVCLAACWPTSSANSALAGRPSASLRWPSIARRRLAVPAPASRSRRRRGLPSGCLGRLSGRRRPVRLVGLSHGPAVGRRPEGGEQFRLDGRPGDVQRVVQVHLERDRPAAHQGHRHVVPVLVGRVLDHRPALQVRLLLAVLVRARGGSSSSRSGSRSRSRPRPSACPRRRSAG